MPAFDQERRCFVVRIVYDGPALAGKTTNLRKLCELFPVEHRSEMYTPGSLKGRTMFFDWLEVDAGRLGTQPFRFQLVTVPGQVQRNYRRRPLLEMADAVVFVCDCSPESLPDTRKSFSQLRTLLRKRLPLRIPLVVQANKQDAPGALPAAEIAQILKLDAAIPVVSATAPTGDGVRDTVVKVMRAAMKEVHQQISEGQKDSFSNAPGNADDLFMSMLELEDASEEAAPIDELDEPDEETND
jgi:mutual gliding-motility protein MglA